MEADWSVELGSDAPVIDQGWPGWIDICQDRSRIALLDEVRTFPPLEKALRWVLESNCGMVPTKCDFWTRDEPVDACEYDADPGANSTTANCFVDLMPQAATHWINLAWAERWAEASIKKLQAIRCRNTRVEVVLRQAFNDDLAFLGVSLYISACGISTRQARSTLASALPHALRAICMVNADRESAPGDGAQITMKVQSPAGE